ncbi:MAG: hypothetical protein LBT98_02285 [Puniceicoccales bacterium]|jgi:hypothetical protein|nr:hypothetical protein [Puniceicoccales bacterium]
MDDWIELTAKDMETVLSAAQLGLLRSAVLGPGERDPLPGVLDGVVRRVRSAVAASGKFLLSAEEEKIPKELAADGCALALERLQTRIPPLRLSPDQVRAADNARRNLLRIGRGEGTVSRPAHPGLHLSGAGTFLCLHRRRSRLGSELLEGL